MQNLDGVFCVREVGLGAGDNSVAQTYPSVYVTSRMGESLTVYMEIIDAVGITVNMKAPVARR